jgi:hypothetical protein
MKSLPRRWPRSTTGGGSINGENLHMRNPFAAEEKMAIVILDRGWVYVGLISFEGDWCVIRQARNIRRWGTTRGLGELAQRGPLPSTVLDPAGTVQVPLHALIATLDTEARLWISS